MSRNWIFASSLPCSYPDPDLGLLHKFLSTDDVDVAYFLLQKIESPNELYCFSL